MPQSQKKILLVDDDRFILTLFDKALSTEGFQCLSANSVADALEILKTELPDIILSDYQMPGTDGFEFRSVVLNDKRLKNIPFVFLTSYTDRDMIQRGLDMLAVDYIDKETPVALVVSKLNNILQAIRKQHEKSMNEIRVAAEALNLSSVPSGPPVVEGFKVNFLYKSFEDYPGGDFIDFIRFDNRFTFMILGDVMGKKWGAWFFSFNFLSYIRSAIRLCVFDGDLSTASIIQKINKVIFMDPVLGDVLSTLSLLMIEHETGKVYYSGAGDLPLIWYKAKEKKSLKVNSSGLLLGVMLEGQYNEELIELMPGDQLLVISDGMIDFEENGEKKSDYDLFFNLIQPMLGREETLDMIKNVTFSDKKSKELVDDCSLLFIERI
ncbi:PP2C family protein-serine/threonine phosphatase [Desertivirga brevis]|uniref:PP2C family protein-serine/threonine phosphatase n=1 Tax=Desertivirga brevis TaxID=2810310 RepID=UPI001A960D91|nr:fused response regulator/phosphatase [Pedobacter sp. SYSU D00873]